ncbi:hypothetical protein PENSUB_5003, partial [Penicillium subrubescens]
SNYVQETSRQATSSGSYSHQRNDPLHLRHRWENELVGSASFLFQPELQTPGLPRLQREQPSMKWMHGPSSDIVTLHDLGPQLYQCDEDCLEDYEPESDPGLTLLLENKHQAQGRKKCTSTWYQNITSRSYRHRLKASIQSNVSGFGSFLHKLPTVPMHKTMWNFKGRYNQVSSTSPTSRFISEEQFWLMLARFFGLAALPEQRRASFPSRGEIRYITNYVKSQPTPDDICDNSDDIEDLVKICNRNCFPGIYFKASVPLSNSAPSLSVGKLMIPSPSIGRPVSRQISLPKRSGVKIKMVTTSPLNTARSLSESGVPYEY